MPGKQPFQIAARRRRGRCYELSYRGVLECQAVSLAHGEVNGPDGRRIGHAWIVGDGFVYESTLDEFFTPADYQARFAAVCEHTYTQKEASQWVIQTNHYGPWE